MTQANILIEELANQASGKVTKIAHISGQLDESNIDEKIQEIYKVVEANPKDLNLIFDLENLEYMNSKSIGYITDLYGKITDSGGQVVIAKARPNILDILTVVGLTQLIKSFPSLDEAKNSFATSTIAPPAPATETPVASAAPAVEPVVAPVAQATFVPETPAASSTPASVIAEAPLTAETTAPVVAPPTQTAPPQQ